MSEPAVAASARARPSGVAAASARRWWILGVVGLAQLMVVQAARPAAVTREEMTVRGA